MEIRNLKIRNLTPHEVRIIDDEDNLIAVIPTSGVARANQRDESAGSIEAGGALIPVVKTVFEGTNLPEPSEGVAYIVSKITVDAAAASGRSTEDLFFPSGVPVRDSAGQIIGVRALAQL